MYRERERYICMPIPLSIYVYIYIYIEMYTHQYTYGGGILSNFCERGPDQPEPGRGSSDQDEANM